MSIRKTGVSFWRVEYSIVTANRTEEEAVLSGTAAIIEALRKGALRARVDHLGDEFEKYDERLTHG